MIACLGVLLVLVVLTLQAGRRERPLARGDIARMRDYADRRRRDETLPY